MKKVVVILLLCWGVELFSVQKLLKEAHDLIAAIDSGDLAKVKDTFTKLEGAITTQEELDSCRAVLIDCIQKKAQAVSFQEAQNLRNSTLAKIIGVSFGCIGLGCSIVGLFYLTGDEIPLDPPIRKLRGIVYSVIGGGLIASGISILKKALQSHDDIGMIFDYVAFKLAQLRCNHLP